MTQPLSPLEQDVITSATLPEDSDSTEPLFIWSALLPVARIGIQAPSAARGTHPRESVQVLETVGTESELL